MNHDPPYDLLRRARAILEGGAADEEWLEDFKKLPGSELSTHEVRVLKNPDLRCQHNMPVVAKLLELGYLMKVKMIRNRVVYIQIRINKKGQDALRLRSEFDE